MKKRIAILSGGGDVPGLNAAIKAFVWRMTDDGHEVIGLRRGWASLLNIVPDARADNSAWLMPLSRRNTRAIDRTGGTVLHTSRVNPEIAKRDDIPAHLASQLSVSDERGRYDLTRDALHVIDFLQLDSLVALGGDGTLTFARRLHNEGVPIVAVPKARDKADNPSNYAVVAISEGAKVIGGEFVETGEADAFGNRRLGGIGGVLSDYLEKRGRDKVIYQRLAYLMRSGAPDSLDQLVAN